MQKMALLCREQAEQWEISGGKIARGYLDEFEIEPGRANRRALTNYQDDANPGFGTRVWENVNIPAPTALRSIAAVIWAENHNTDPAILASAFWNASEALPPLPVSGTAQMAENAEAKLAEPAMVKLEPGATVCATGTIGTRTLNRPKGVS